MSTIPTSVTEEQFMLHIYPHLNTAKRGYECKIPLYKVFNYMLHHLHTGCQWDRLPIKPDAVHPEKGKSVLTRCIIIIASGAAMVASKRCGSAA